MSKGKSYLLYVLGLCAILCVGLVLYRASDRNTIDPVLQQMYKDKAYFETKLAKQIIENKQLQSMLNSGQLAENEYRKQKDNIQNKINNYIHTQSTEVFPQERDLLKLPSPEKKKPNLKEQELRQELGLLIE